MLIFFSNKLKLAGFSPVFKRGERILAKNIYTCQCTAMFFEDIRENSAKAVIKIYRYLLLVDTEKGFTSK